MVTPPKVGNLHARMHSVPGLGQVRFHRLSLPPATARPCLRPRSMCAPGPDPLCSAQPPRRTEGRRPRVTELGRTGRARACRGAGVRPGRPRTHPSRQRGQRPRAQPAPQGKSSTVPSDHRHPPRNERIKNCKTASVMGRTVPSPQAPRTSESDLSWK